MSGQAASFGCTASVDWMEDSHPYYPPTVNDADAARFALGVAGELVAGLPGGGVSETEGTMAGEDFGFLARAVPACMLLLGTANASAGAGAGLHTPRFALDEGVLKLGAALHASLAARYLETAAAAAAGGGGKDEL